MLLMSFCVTLYGMIALELTNFGKIPCGAVRIMFKSVMLEPLIFGLHNGPFWNKIIDKETF